MAVMYLSTKFGGIIIIQSEHNDIFHLGFSWQVNLSRSTMMVVYILSCVRNLVQISRLIDENNPPTFVLDV